MPDEKKNDGKDQPQGEKKQMGQINAEFRDIPFGNHGDNKKNKNKGGSR